MKHRGFWLGLSLFCAVPVGLFLRADRTGGWATLLVTALCAGLWCALWVGFFGPWAADLDRRWAELAERRKRFEAEQAARAAQKDGRP